MVDMLYSADAKTIKDVYKSQALDKQTYLFLSKASYTARNKKANIGEPRDCYI